MEKSIKSSAINYGVYLGAALSLITITIWFVNLNLMANIWLGIGILLAAIAFGVVSTAKSKSIMNGFLTFKEAFSSYFITIAVGVIISQVVSFILFNFIDPEAAKQIQQITIDSTINMMEGFGAPAETIAEAVEKIENTDQFSIVSVLKSTAWSLVFQAVIGLIVAAIMKKSNPDA
jgi:Protein of unknown function (DUF4199)